ncbi:MAG: GntR family transcriptional regulator [Acidimicrobiia bacterium]|nr:GntR family transcriptional regulator [Acidimicrobiia bacterium]
MTRRNEDVGPGEPIRHLMLGDQIKDHLLTQILEGVIAPGERIIETRVARELGISQGPVREALRDLATLGLVDLQPYRGARVRQPSLEEQVEAMRVRAELEAMAAREAAGNLSTAQIEELHRLNDEMSALAAAGDTHGHAVKNTEFHSIIVEASGNRTLERILAMLQPLAQTYLTVSVGGLSAPEVYAMRHGSILDALVAGDPDGAEAAMRSHGRANVAMVEQARISVGAPAPTHPRRSGDTHGR